MVVQHNLTAMNSNRMLGLTTATQAKSTEKLSSGYKINRAADDAAGLSISEKMRKQIRGLTQASANAQDGISAVQTAEGALTEVHDMLQRMNELAVKAANGTNSEDDRNYIQDEIDQLVTEIDRVAETTKFNETYLLKGDAATGETTYGYTDAYTEITDMDGAIVTLYDICGNTVTGNAAIELQEKGEALYSTQTTKTAASNTDLKAATVTKVDMFDAAGHLVAKAGDILADQVVTSLASFYDAQGATMVAANVAGISISQKPLYNADGTQAYATGASVPYASVEDYYNTVTLGKEAVEGEFYKITEYGKLYDKDGNGIAANGLDSYFKIDDDGTRVYKGGLYDADGNAVGVAGKAFEDTENATLAKHMTSGKAEKGALELNLHVGADATDNNQIEMKIDAMDAKTLGISDIRVDGATDENALDAIETIKAAIQKVSTQRSALGAIQNRLEHTINNLDNVVENTTSAESQIRDTDMATEMVKYSNNNILSQAGQAMLAQANQSNQGVLSLLG